MEINYGLIYTIPFARLANEACVVEIEKEGYTGNTMELIGSDSPFDVEVEDDDFLYIPTRFSTARIRVVGGDYLQQLYSTSYQQYRVTFKRDGVVAWTGFVKPEIYTQDYSSEKFELEIECHSAMSVLEFINYKQIGVDGRVFVSLFDLMKKCVSESRGRYSSVYIPHVYAKNKANYDAGTNVLSEMYVSEQNFFDEDDKAMKLKEVLEEICKFLNWTCVDYLGSLYFVDADHIGEYYKYNLDMSSFSKWIPGKVLNIQSIGFSGADQSLDKLNGYNKVTVRTNNYCMPDLTAEEEYDDLDNAVTQNTRDGNKAARKITLLPEKIDMRQYKNENGVIEPLTKEYVRKEKERANEFLGAMPMKYCAYEMTDSGPSIDEYRYTNAVQFRLKQPNKSQEDNYKINGVPLLSIKGDNRLYPPGAFCISCDFAFTLRSDIGAIINPEKYWKSVLVCGLRVGNEWYTGEFFARPFRTFEIKSNQGKDDKVEWMSVKNTKSLDSPYDGLVGWLIEINYPVKGELEFIIYSATAERWNGNDAILYPYGMFVKNLKIQYKSADSVANKSKNDRYYENIVNEDYINELDEIEFKISSYNNDGACYSKVLLDDNYLTNNLYASVVDEAIRPEELLIRRIVNRYDATRIKLTQVLKETPELTPLTKLSDNFMVGKIFMPVGGSIDYKMGQFKCVMVEV